MKDSTISNNTADVHGGAIYNENSDPEISNCTFTNNSAVSGGGMYNRAYDDYANPLLTNCRFISNSAEQEGGAMHNDYSFPTLINCTLSGNSAERGGGIYSRYGSIVTLTNCTFAANLATNGKALAFHSHDPEHPYSSELYLTNCILWDGGDEIWNNDGSTITVTYSDVEAGWPGPGNIDTDPCFADPESGDYHLKSQADRWDPPTADWIQDDVTSPCIDAGDKASPVGYEPFPNGGVINMGAYGGTAEASKSYFGEPVCQTIVAGDINGDCKVDWRDFSLMAFHWLTDDNP
jgi:predicted outer membrane repeat protein